MILGLPIDTFTQIHVVISLLAIATGVIVAFAMAAGRRVEALTTFFLASTLLTSITGFLFPFGGVTPGIVFGALSIVALAFAYAARHAFSLAGPWRWVFVVSSLFALYLNVFVGIVQAFQKQPLLQPLAPTQSEPPFLIVQALVLALFVVVGARAVRRFGLNG